MDMTHDSREAEAAFKGGKLAGKYLDSINKTDLGDLSLDEYKTFCATLFYEACNHMRRIADDEIPF